jgi:photosystem II stability/assembly factor-like uncharacterized protein
MLKHSLLGFVFAASAILASAQVPAPTLTPQVSGTTQLLISVSPVDSNIVWASGTGGTFVVTTDGGNTWKAGVVPGAEALQFRDVQGVSDQIAYLMSIGDNTSDFKMYKTTDGGATWKIQFVNQLANAFYDCFAFWTPDRGIAHSDSVNGVFPDLRISNGQRWISIANNMPPALPGEASFSSSGTCITTEGANNAWITTGGSTTARVLATKDRGTTWNAYNLPLVSNASAGGLSVAFRDQMHGVVGGGDLANNASAGMAISGDGGVTWALTKKPPVQGSIFALAYARGIRGATPGTATDHQFDRTIVITAERAPAFAQGTAAYTPDEGQSWFILPNSSGYWGAAFANPQAGWLVGNNGQILKISF